MDKLNNNKNENVNSIKKYGWLFSPAGVISIICILISGVIFFLVNFVPYDNNYRDTYAAMMISVSASVFSIIANVTFVQWIIDRKNIKEKEREECEKIIRIHQYLKIIYNWYIIAYNELVTPLPERNLINNSDLKDEFEMSDLCDLNFSSLYIKSGWKKSVAEVFFDIEKQLYDCFCKLLNEVDFKFNKNLYEIVISFLNVSVNYNSKDAILNDYQMIPTDEDKKQYIRKFIIEYGKKYYNELYKAGKLNNVITPYCLLYDMLKLERDMLNKYFTEVSNIEKRINDC